VLQAVFAGAVAAQLAVNGSAPGFEICLGDPDGASIPGHGQTNHHESCAIHCAAFAGLTAFALALIALVFAPRSTPLARYVAFRPATDFLQRAGRSRAPPRPA